MKLKITRMNILIVLTVLLLAWIAWGYFSIMNVEQLSYTVLDDTKEYELRQFDDHIIAETEVSGNYDDATNSGFMVVADYIFGNNTAQESVAMTTPVINEDGSSPIAMTTPVINNEEDGQTRTIAFVMPSKYTMETLPKPNNPKVKIKEVKGEKTAVLRFSWWVTAEKLQRKKEELQGYLDRDGLKVKEWRTSRYNPPWTPPFMLRNEVWAILES